MLAMLDYDCLIVLDSVAFGDDGGGGGGGGVGGELTTNMDWNN